MTTFVETKQPYELLVRWDAGGVLQGAQVQYRTIVTKDGAPFTESVDPALPLGLDGSGDFPLDDVLTQVQADALAQVSVLTAANAVLDSQVDTLTAQVDALTSEKATLQAQVDSLTAALAAATPPA